jgi:Transposase DDE domain
MPIEDFIIRVYCEVCAAYERVVKTRLRRRGFSPALSDQEVLALELVGSCLGYSNDKAIWEYFVRHWHAWFPALGERSTFVRHAANLWAVKGKLHRYWADTLGATGHAVHLVDGFPVPVCHFRRAHFSKVFRGEAAFGFCASKGETYYGFKGMLLTTDDGIIEDIALVAANIDERDALVDFDLHRIAGLLLGDKGFIRPLLKEDLSRQGIDLQTPLRGNMKESRSAYFRHWMMASRRLVETVIGQLTERFQIENNRARDLWHLVSRLYRKVAAHTLCILINRQLGRPSLQFDGLVAV